MLGLDLLAVACLAATTPETAPWRLPEPLCCTQDFTRRAVVETGDTAAASLTVRVEPAATLTATSRALDAHRLEISLRASASGTGTLEVLDAQKTVRLRRKVQVMAITTDSVKSIGTEETRPDGTTVFIGQTIITPYQPGLDVRFVCLASQVKVPDGLSESWIASETFTPNAAGTSAQTTFRMVRAPGGRYVPFTYILYQEGEQVSAP